jgi:hypothetical protein
MQAGTLIGTPFQFWMFGLASLINFLVDWSKLVSRTIRFFTDLLLKEVKKKGDKAVCAAMEQESKHEAMGQVIGFLEKEVYLYALIAQIQPLIGTVLVFKGFTGWLRAECATNDQQNEVTLVRFYNYAIGNLISLLWAIGIFEFLHWLMRSSETVRHLIWIPPGICG